MTDPSSETPETASTDTQDVTSESSAETQDQGVGSLIDAVNTALGEAKPEATPASTEPDSKEPVPKPEEGDELSDEEKRQLSVSAQRRFRELVDARRTVEAERDTIRQEVDTLKPKAERMDHLLGYMRTNNVAPEHLDNALGLTALINKGDYDKALPILENLISQVRSAAGEVLPEDLQQRVRLGYITEADAKELHKARSTAKRTTERAEQDRQRAEQERAQAELSTMVNTAASAADDWHREQVASDPDWNLKRDLVTQRMELELHRLGREGYPRNRESVRKLLDTVKAEVEQGLKRFRPAPKPIAPPPTGGSASPRSAAMPKSALEAVNIALGE